jgi:hypothetical protein
MSVFTQMSRCLHECCIVGLNLVFRRPSPKICIFVAPQICTTNTCVRVVPMYILGLRYTCWHSDNLARAPGANILDMVWGGGGGILNLFKIN